MAIEETHVGKKRLFEADVIQEFTRRLQADGGATIVQQLRGGLDFNTITRRLLSEVVTHAKDDTGAGSHPGSIHSSNSQGCGAESGSWPSSQQSEFHRPVSSTSQNTPDNAMCYSGSELDDFDDQEHYEMMERIAEAIQAEYREELEQVWLTLPILLCKDIFYQRWLSCMLNFISLHLTFAQPDTNLTPTFLQFTFLLSLY